MKKTYTKPEIYFDSFELSQSIAAGCEGIANYAENMCSVTISDIGWVIINSGISGCQRTGPGYEDMICYHVPSDANNVFSS